MALVKNFSLVVSWLVLTGIAHECSAIEFPEVLPKTERLEMEGDIASHMVAGIDRFLLQELAASRDLHEGLGPRDFSSPARYSASLAPRRERLAHILGAVDERLPLQALEYVATTAQSARIGRGRGYEIFQVRWPVFTDVWGEGLLLVPDHRPHLANVIAIPDADHTPEMLVGLVPGVPHKSQFARHLAERGCRVVVPLLIDRAHEFSTTVAGTRPTGQPHREFLYRPAFELGRHIIGYEVNKIRSLVDWFTHEAKGADPTIGVYGYGEGGLLALHVAALDPRVDVTCCSGYFGPREGVWREPIYRNVFGLLQDFGDAELASMVPPSKLVVEACAAPNHPQSATPGTIDTPSLEDVTAEFHRAVSLCSAAPWATDHLQLVVSDAGHGPFGSEKTRDLFLELLRDDAPTADDSTSTSQTKQENHSTPPEALVVLPSPQERMRRQVGQLDRHTQRLLHEAEYTRTEFWAKTDRSSLERWRETTAPYREYFRDEIIGRFERELLPPCTRTRKVYDQPKYVGYEVVLDVFPDVIAYGILLLPKDLQPGERRPVVVCQHGLEGRPQDVADPDQDHPAYHRYACRLAERGFITYAPQNIYIFQDRFRTLQRKANPLGKTLFSIMVPQHRQATDWLAGLPWVDPERIAFYGLSYGGKTAMRVPPLVDRYCLSICSADFNEWIWKNASTRSPYSYVSSGEYEIFEFNLGNTFNYAEMAGLIAPRPFMVERGHRDGVAPDHRVAQEYAKIRLLYADLGIPKKTTIEFFDGPHTIHGEGTFDFLHEQLDWPKP